MEKKKGFGCLKKQKNHSLSTSVMASNDPEAKSWISHLGIKMANLTPPKKKKL